MPFLFEFSINFLLGGCEYLQSYYYQTIQKKSYEIYIIYVNVSVRCSEMVLFLVTGCTIKCCTVLVQNVPLSLIREDQFHGDHFVIDFQ